MDIMTFMKTTPMVKNYVQTRKLKLYTAAMSRMLQSTNMTKYGRKTIYFFALTW